MDTAHRIDTLALSPAAADAAALDIVLAAHKAMRRFLFETLVQIGSLDVTDPGDILCTVNLLDRLLDVLGEPRAAWAGPMNALRHGAASQRHGVAAALYRSVADLVARHLARLQRSENIAPWATPAPVGVARLQQLDDDELRDALGWMAGALTPQELAALLDELHGASTPARFQAALAVLSERLDARRWHQLSRALGAAPLATAPAAEAAAAAAAA